MRRLLLDCRAHNDERPSSRGLLQGTYRTSVAEAGASINVSRSVASGRLQAEICRRHLPDQIAEAGASLNELITADFLRAVAFVGLDAAADDVLSVMRRACRSGACAMTGVFETPTPPTGTDFVRVGQMRHVWNTQQPCTAASGPEDDGRRCMTGLRVDTGAIPFVARLQRPPSPHLRARASCRRRGGSRKRRQTRSWRGLWPACGARGSLGMRLPQRGTLPPRRSNRPSGGRPIFQVSEVQLAPEQALLVHPMRIDSEDCLCHQLGC